MARALGYLHAEINILDQSHKQDPVGAAKKILLQWMSKDPEHSWAKLISALVDASEELKVTASDLQFALTHQL